MPGSSGVSRLISKSHTGLVGSASWVGNDTFYFIFSCLMPIAGDFRTWNIASRPPSISILFPSASHTPASLNPSFHSHPQCHPCLCLHSAPSPWTPLHLLLGSISWCSFFKAQVICHLQEGTLESVLALVKFPITEYLKHLPGLWIQTHLSLNLGD